MENTIVSLSTHQYLNCYSTSLSPFQNLGAELHIYYGNKKSIPDDEKLAAGMSMPLLTAAAI
jgi:hypothetical protein